MMNGGRPLMGALGILVLWTGTRVIAAESSGSSPYQGIVERNVFGLKPPPPPPDPEANKPPPPKIYLQGIMTFGGTTRALLKVQVPPKPPDPAKEVPLILAEGQRDGDVEVLEINDTHGSEFVKVNDFGTITNLNFENNGIKTAGAAAPGGQSGPPKGGPPPGANPSGANPFGSAGGPRPGGSPVRPMRLPPTGAAASSGGSGSYGQTLTPASYAGTPAPNTYSAVPAAPTYGSAPAVVTGGGTTPTLTLPGMASAPTTAPPQQNWPPETPMTPEQAAVANAVYMTQNKDAIQKGLMPSIPGYNPLLDEGNSSAQPATPARTAPPLPPGAARQYVPQ
jgi:hypothetical protein